MIRSLLLGLVAGARSVTPFAAVAAAAYRKELPEDDAATQLLGHPVVAGGALALAAGEMAGDKMKTAPDRIVILGIGARLASAAIAGAALAPKEQRVEAAVLTAAVATASAYATFALRMKTLRRYGQSRSGFVEDAIVLAATGAIMRGLQPKAA